MFSAAYLAQSQAKSVRILYLMIQNCNNSSYFCNISSQGGIGDTSDVTSGEKKIPQHSRPIIIIREGSVATADDSVEPEPSEPQTNHQTLIAADPPSFASRSTRSGCESPHQSTRVELGSPRRVGRMRLRGFKETMNLYFKGVLNSKYDMLCKNQL